MKNTAIFLIDYKNNNVMVQIDVPEHKDYMSAVNIELNLTENLVYFDNFAIPGMSDYHKFGGIGDMYIKTINYFSKAIGKVWNEDLTIIDFLEKIKRIFKIKEYQLNINSYFDREHLSKYDLKAMLNVAYEIENFKREVKL